MFQDCGNRGAWELLVYCGDWNVTQQSRYKQQNGWIGGNVPLLRCSCDTLANGSVLLCMNRTLANPSARVRMPQQEGIRSSAVMHGCNAWLQCMAGDSALKKSSHSLERRTPPDMLQAHDGSTVAAPLVFAALIYRHCHTL